MCRCKLRTITVNVSAGFTDDLKIADYRVLRKLAREKVVLTHIRRIAFNPLNGLKDVFQVIDSTNRLIDHEALHRARFGEYGVSDIFGKRFWRRHVNRDTQQLAQFTADGTDVKKGGFRGRINQDVQVAMLGVLTAHSRPEHTRISSAV
jgi:hypothetical protein